MGVFICPNSSNVKPEYFTVYTLFLTKRNGLKHKETYKGLY